MRSAAQQFLFLVPIALFSSACNDEKCGGTLLQDGDYVITEVLGPVDPDRPWLQGAQIQVDRAARQMTIRYQRDGSTFEVRYTLTSEHLQDQ